MCRVVIVDDEPAARRGLRHHLEGYPDIEIAGEAGNVASALALIDKTRPDAVFMDVEMPGVDGLEAAHHLDSSIKLIFVTAHSRHAHRAFEVEALDYVLKPLHPSRIAQVVERLRRSRPEGAAGGSSAGTAVFPAPLPVVRQESQDLGGHDQSRARLPWLPPSPEELAVQLPQFAITRLIGKGGMGAVYEGVQRGLDRAVAIKILPAYAGGRDGAFAARFRTEARAMARLKHPGIVTVHDVGETPRGMLYIVMELIDGMDVQRMLEEQGRLPPEAALTIIQQVCAALAYAHKRGVIHRDIKPANIMVDVDGTVKVADFGIAKVVREGPRGDTTKEATMGTHHYSAPELQAQHGVLDERAEIYAVGVTLYQMLTGRLPQGVFEMPSVQIRGLDRRLDAIVVKALRQEPELRYQQVSELQQDLQSLKTRPATLRRVLKSRTKVSPFHSSLEAGGPSVSSPWQWWLAAAVVLALAFALVALRPLGRGKDAPAAATPTKVLSAAG